MSDIVERLRSLAKYEHDDLSIGTEAADEIERLRAELDTWKSVFPDIAPDAVLPSRTAEIASAVDAERERCAALADRIVRETNSPDVPRSEGRLEAAMSIAAAIRGGDTR